MLTSLRNSDLLLFAMDSSFTDNPDYEAELRMALVEEYARQPLVRVPRVQELQGSTEEQLPMDGCKKKQQ